MIKIGSISGMRRLLGVSLLLCLSGLGTWNINVPSTSAQGAFGGALLDLVPIGATIASTLGTGSSGEFFVSGNVYLSKTVTCTTIASASDSFVNFGAGATRVGTWRMWGFRSPEPVITNSVSGQPFNNISAGKPAAVNMTIHLDSFNGTLELQGTLIGGTLVPGETVFSQPLSDVLAITGGTGTFRSASGDATITPVTDVNGVNCGNGAFRIVLTESPRLPRFGNIIP
jgi:hypothetical protein